MLAYRTNDGARVTGATSREVIKALRRQSHLLSRSLNEWMEEVAARAELQNGAHIPTDSEAGFVAGLLSAGLLKPDNEEEKS